MTHSHSYVVISQILLFIYSFNENNIGDTGARALAEGLQYWSNLHELRLVHNTTLHHMLCCIALHQAGDTRKYLIFATRHKNAMQRNVRIESETIVLHYDSVDTKAMQRNTWCSVEPTFKFVLTCPFYNCCTFFPIVVYIQTLEEQHR